jgi:hypothetical protein
MKLLEFEKHLSALEKLDVDTGRVNQIKIQAAVARLRAVFNAVNDSDRPLCANPECLNPSVPARAYIHGQAMNGSKYCSDELGLDGGSGCGSLVPAKRHRDKNSGN